MDSQRPAAFETLVEIARRRARDEPERRLYSFRRERSDATPGLTCGALDRAARALAAAIQQQAPVGARVLLAVPPGLDFLRAVFGCLYAGAVCVPAPLASVGRIERSLPRLRRLAIEAEVGLALAGDAERIAAIRAAAPELAQVSWLPLAGAGEGASHAWRAPDLTADTLAVLQFTSGSLSEPRGVMVSHGNLMANLRALKARLCGAAPVEGVMWVPPYHDMGLVGGILLALYNGHHVTLIPPLDFLKRPLIWLETVARQKATHSAVPNFAFDLAVERSTPAQRAALDLSGLRMLLSGGEPVDAGALERFAAAFAVSGFDPRALTPAYGLAESTLLASVAAIAEPPGSRVVAARALEAGSVESAPPGRAARTLVCCGRAEPDGRIAIVDPATHRPLGPGRIGEIWLQGPSVAQGYWRRPGESAATFQARLADGSGPFLRTGDLGFLSDEGLYPTGRIKELILVNGRNHYPRDIERSLEEAEPLLVRNGSAAFGFAEDGSERLAVVAEVKRRAADPEALAARLREAVSLQHELPLARLVLIRRSALPRTTSGKIRRAETRRRLSSGELAALYDWRAGSANHANRASLAGNGDRAPVIAWLRREIATLAGVPAARLAIEAPLARAGLSSLEIADLAQRAELQFDVALPLEALPPEATIAELAGLIVGAAHAPAQAERLAPRPEGRDDAGIGSDDSGPGGAALVQLRARMAALAERGLENPFFPLHEAIGRATTRIRGRALLNFASYNYLGLSGDPRVSAAAKAAIDDFGTSVSASRLVSGERPLHRALERAIAELIGTEDSIVFVSGNLTNVTVIGHIVGPGDLIVCDALAHDSILQGAKLSGAARRSFPHNDVAALERILAAQAGRHRNSLIVVEGVYSMDGDIADLARLVEVKRRHGAWLMVDEAHSIGTLGPHGRGLAEHFRIPASSVDLWMGTLSKAFASCGGYIAGRAALVESLKYSAPGFVFSVGLPPASAGAALAAIEILRTEPERVRRLQARAAYFLRLARDAGLDTGLSAGTPVVPVILGETFRAIACASRLRERGVNVLPIVHPAVPEDAARLRFFLCADHQEAQIDEAVQRLTEVLAELESRPPQSERRAAQSAGAQP